MNRKLRILCTLITSLALLVIMSAATNTDAASVASSTLYLQEGTDIATVSLEKAPSPITVAGQDQNWYSINFGEDTGYVHKAYLSILPASRSAASIMEEANEALAILAPSVQQQVVDTACSYIGVRYRYGGASPKGFDCSGFTMYVYSQFGISIPHGASSQTKYGTAVERSHLQMGDLVFFRDTRITSRAASHVGIYIGGNKFIHAASTSTGHVIVSGLDETYWNTHYAGARRLLTQ